jgi:hypothetical protein
MIKTSLGAICSFICLVFLLHACETANHPYARTLSNISSPPPRYALIGAELISISPSEIKIKTIEGKEEVYKISEKTRYFDENQREIVPSSFAPGDSIAIRADIDGKAPVDWIKKGASVKIRFP